MKAHALTPEQSQALLAALPQKYQLFFALSLYTGFRVSELLSLTYQDLASTHIVVARKNMKGKFQSRRVPKHPNLVPYIQAHPITDGPLFPVTREFITRLISQTAKSLGFHASTHSGRKTFAKKIFEHSGKNLVLTQQALGHRNVSSTISYLEVSYEDVEAAILS